MQFVRWVNGQARLIDEHGHWDGDVLPDEPVTAWAPRPCPWCELRIGRDPCRTCKRRGDVDAHVECDHLCKHGGNRAHTGECCYRGPTYGEACEYDE